MIQTEVLSLSKSDIIGLVDMVNAVYDIAEKGIWKTYAKRISEQRLKSLIRSSSVIAARSNTTIVGVIVLQSKTTDIAEFGMLSTHIKHQSKGIGTILISAAEDLALDENHKIMQLELLIPKHVTNQSKIKLQNWYLKLGYKAVKKESFEVLYPEKVADLAIECDFTIWQKQLLNLEN